MIKSILFFALFSLTSSTLHAQYDSKGEYETSRFRPGLFWYFTGLFPAKDEKVRKYDRLFFDISYNDWTGDLKPFGVKPSSIGFGTNLLFDVPLTKGNTVSFGWGFNHHWTHIRHDNTFFHNLTAKTTEYTELTQNIKSALNFHQISIPLELRFHKESWRHFKFHVGGKLGYAFGFHENTHLNNPGKGKTVIKDFNFQDSNPLQYSAHVRLGIRNYAVFGEYHFSPLFTEAKSTQLNILRFGISLSLF